MAQSGSLKLHRTKPQRLSFTPKIIPLLCPFVYNLTTEIEIVRNICLRAPDKVSHTHPRCNTVGQRSVRGCSNNFVECKDRWQLQLCPSLSTHRKQLSRMRAEREEVFDSQGGPQLCPDIQPEWLKTVDLQSYWLHFHSSLRPGGEWQQMFVCFLK